MICQHTNRLLDHFALPINSHLFKSPHRMRRMVQPISNLVPTSHRSVLILPLHGDTIVKKCLFTLLRLTGRLLHFTRLLYNLRVAVLLLVSEISRRFPHIAFSVVGAGAVRWILKIVLFCPLVLFEINRLRHIRRHCCWLNGLKLLVLVTAALRVFAMISPFPHLLEIIAASHDVVFLVRVDRFD